MNARQFAAASIAARLLWASVTLALAALLSTHAFAEFAFLQITTSLGTQLVFGVLGNIVTARLAEIPGESERTAMAIAAALYGALAGLLCYVPLLGLGAIGVPHLDPLGATAVSAWMVGGYASSVLNALYVSQSRYVRAAVLCVSQPLVYVAALATFGTSSGTMASLAAAIGQTVPYLVSVYVNTRPPRRFWEQAGALLAATARSHRQATTVNLSYVPSLLLLWVLAATLATHSSLEIAKYGLANQIASLFLFLPTSIAPIAISRFATMKGPEKRNLRRNLVISFVLAGAAAGGLLLLAISLFRPNLPTVISQANWTISAAAVMAGLVAARSPFAWLNQIEARTRSEAAVALVGAAVTALALLLPNLSALELLATRTAAAGLVLLLSVYLYNLAGASSKHAAR